MDKLKENAFAYSLAGLGVIFLVLFYMLVLGPLGTFATKQEDLEKGDSSLKKLLRLEVLPRPAYVDYVKQQGELNKSAFDTTLENYREKTKAFQLYFGDEPTPPPNFYPPYQDGINALQRAYREKHNLATAPVDTRRGQPVDLPASVELVKQEDVTTMPEEAIPLAMKQYWIVDEVFRACETLKLAGLGSIRFPKAASRDRGFAKEKEQQLVDFDYITAEVKINLRFREIDAFLRALYASERVPFLEPEEITVTKNEELQKDWLKLPRLQEYDSIGEAKNVVYDKDIVEPTLEVTFLLRALDYRGLREVKEEGSEEK